MAKLWKKGRGKLGFLDPLLGVWETETVSDNGPVKCLRRFEPVLHENYVRLTAYWTIGKPPKPGAKAADKDGDKPDAKPDAKTVAKTGYTYKEIALFGAGGEKNVRFWSFTSDGKHTNGVAADVSDLHPEAVGFEATVMGQHARQAYWPKENGEMVWVVEAKTKKGWNRFVEHWYTRVPPAADRAG
ncbi:MAG: hypothetical protein WD715_13540 [Dongiaceae bacterium]